MSILIKGMEMPKSCYECKFRGWGGDKFQYEVCSFGGRNRLRGKYDRPDYCPLIEVPPHGRLIDADALIKLLDNCMFPSDMVTTQAVSMARNWLIDAPTIIESEE